MTDPATGAADIIIGMKSDDAGNTMNWGNERITFVQTYSTSLPQWLGVVGSVSLNEWHHIVVTKDSTISTTAPILYIDGVAQAWSVSPVPTGSIKDETGLSLTIGNTKTATVNYSEPVPGRIADARIYNGKILTPDEVATIYNAGTIKLNAVPGGLSFQAACLRNRDFTDKLNTALSSVDKVIDNALGYVGSVHGTPTVRTLP